MALKGTELTKRRETCPPPAPANTCSRKVASCPGSDCSVGADANRGERIGCGGSGAESLPPLGALGCGLPPPGCSSCFYPSVGLPFSLSFRGVRFHPDGPKRSCGSRPSLLPPLELGGASRLVPKDQLFTAPPDPRFSRDPGRIQLLRSDPEAAPVRQAGLCGVASRCTRGEDTAWWAGRPTPPAMGTVRRLEAAGGPSSATSARGSGGGRLQRDVGHGRKRGEPQECRPEVSWSPVGDARALSSDLARRL